MLRMMDVWKLPVFAALKNVIVLPCSTSVMLFCGHQVAKQICLPLRFAKMFTDKRPAILPLAFPVCPEVTLDEFIDGIMRCKGPARAIDQALGGEMIG